MIVQVEGVTRPVHRLSDEFAAVRLHFSWFGTRKTLSTGQKASAALTFGADGQFLSAGKKLLDTKNEAYRKCTGIKTEARKYWQNRTLPYPEVGVRLIRMDDVSEFENHMESLQAELRVAVVELDQNLPGIIENSRRKLGDLFNAADYPTSFANEFSMEWDYPNMKPPEYLRTINPEVYEAEVRRIQQRFTEAAELAEQAFLEEFSQMVEQLKERMAPDADGQKKKFKNSTVENLKDFFERFSHLNVGCRDDLEELVEQAQRAMNGVTADSLRDSDSMRRQIHDTFSDINSRVADMIENAPRRSFG